MTWEPNCENASGDTAAAQIIARSLSKFGWMGRRRERCVAFVPFCQFAPLHHRAQIRRDIDGGVVS